MPEANASNKYKRNEACNYKHRYMHLTNIVENTVFLMCICVCVCIILLNISTENNIR